MNEEGSILFPTSDIAAGIATQNYYCRKEKKRRRTPGKGGGGEKNKTRKQKRSSVGVLGSISQTSALLAIRVYKENGILWLKEGAKGC